MTNSNPKTRQRSTSQKQKKSYDLAELIAMNQVLQQEISIKFSIARKLMAEIETAFATLITTGAELDQKLKQTQAAPQPTHTAKTTKPLNGSGKNMGMAEPAEALAVQ